ncbi:hypothetical protein RRG08_004236 [Elysia crispata]|uniref:Uncharacterized protein n=1 Tax=Elysia crispata TaxID=231223 RepID=A0AAE0ZJK4_9GAST|nr:hypothetical protein RRG08_004236 [Elysia crispata]
MALYSIRSFLMLDSASLTKQESVSSIRHQRACGAPIGTRQVESSSRGHLAALDLFLSNKTLRWSPSTHLMMVQIPLSMSTWPDMNGDRRIWL